MMDKDQIQDYIEKLEKLTEIEEQLGDGDFQLMKELENLIESLGKDINSTITSDTNKIQVKIKKLVPHATIPKYAKPGDAGMDLVITNILKDTPKEMVYSFGIAIEIPVGYVGLIFPRSSVRNTDLTLANCVGVIDSGYRGELQATFKKFQGSESIIYKIGDRGAQIIIIPIPQIEFIESEELSETERGVGGHGSTGS